MESDLFLTDFVHMNHLFERETRLSFSFQSRVFKALDQDYQFSHDSARFLILGTRLVGREWKKSLLLSCFVFVEMFSGSMRSSNDGFVSPFPQRLRV